MIRRIIKRFGVRKLIWLGADILAFEIAAILSSMVYFNGKELVSRMTLPLEHVFVYTFATILSVVSFRYHDLYKQKIVAAGGKQIRLLMKNALITFFIVLAVRFFVKPGGPEYSSRSQLLEFVLLSYSLIFFARYLFYRNLHSARGMSKLNERNVLVIGAGVAGYHFAEELKKHRSLGFKVVGFLDDNPEMKNMPVNGFQVLGTTGEIEKISQMNDVDEVFIAIKSIDHERLLYLVEQCRRAKCQINILSDHFGIIEKKVGEQEFKDLRFVSLFQNTSNFYIHSLKRWIDMSGALILVIVLFPVLCVIALLVKITSKGPVFYAPTSIGKNGEPFTFYKFRSMYHNISDEKHKILVEDFMSGKIIGAKLRNDPRVTKVGGFLRKYSLDEFAQLINVLKGNMSLVGPRPSTSYEYEMMEDWHRKRFHVVPGMTGLWQVSGRAEVSFIDMIMMDIYYVENCSLWLDVNILFKTIGVVLKAKGGH